MYVIANKLLFMDGSAAEFTLNSSICLHIGENASTGSRGRGFTVGFASGVD